MAAFARRSWRLPCGASSKPEWDEVYQGLRRDSRHPDRRQNCCDDDVVFRPADGPNLLQELFEDFVAPHVRDGVEPFRARLSAGRQKVETGGEASDQFPFLGRETPKSLRYLIKEENNTQAPRGQMGWILIAQRTAQFEGLFGRLRDGTVTIVTDAGNAEFFGLGHEAFYKAGVHIHIERGQQSGGQIFESARAFQEGAPDHVATIGLRQRKQPRQ
jgi:hypothetical protein